MNTIYGRNCLMDKNTEEFEGGAGGSSISADLIRGHINTIILRSLYDRDKYGYEIINEINEKSHGQYTLKQPTLYSALKRLENQGYIQAYWKHDEVSAGGRRKYFRLTESGKEVAETNRAEWEYSRTVIDNLISDRNFDFSQPAPTPVDFKILKQATSRVPVVHGEAGSESGEQGDEATSAETEQDITLVAGDSNTVYIDDPSAPVEPDEVFEDGVDEPAYSSETEKDYAYSESIFNDGTPPAGGEFPEPEAEDEGPAEGEGGNAYELVEESPADFDIPPINETENSPEEYAQASVAATANEPEVFLQQPTDEAEEADDGYQPTVEEPETEQLQEVEEQPEDVEAESEEPQPVEQDLQTPVPEPESAAAEPEAVEEEPIYSLPSQSYAQAVAHEEVVEEGGTNSYDQSADEARRIAHENYMKLIAGEAKRDSREDDEEAKNLVYNMRSEQERDYKNLIDRLFDGTVSSAPAPTYRPESAPQPQPRPEPETEPEQFSERTVYPRTSFFDAGDKAAADGLRISTSDEAFAAGSAKQTTYNRGATLFKCSLIVGVIILLEFTLILLFRNNLGVSLAYPIVILVLGLALVLVCGILYGTGYGINVRKPTSLRYIMTMTIITVIIIAIIFIAAIIMNVNWTDGNDILAKIILPIIIALNIPIFTLSFYLLTK